MCKKRKLSLSKNSPRHSFRDPPSTIMSSDAGGGETRRRRDLNSTVCVFSSFSVFLIFLLSSLFPQPLQTFPKTYSTQISQMSSPFSESIQILPEEPSHRASLMAGDLPLGPSDAPCPVEASTAHGDPIFWVEISWSPYCASSEKMVRLITHSLEFFRSATKFARLRTIWYRATTFTSKSEAIPVVHRRTVLKMVIPSSPPPTFPNLTFSWRRKLGYQIMGLSIFGPIITFWTYVRNEAPTPQLNRPRFVLIQPFTLSFMSKLRYNTEIGRRRLSRTVPTLTQELVGFYLIGLKQLQLSIIHTLAPTTPGLPCDLLLDVRSGFVRAKQQTGLPPTGLGSCRTPTTPGLPCDLLQDVRSGFVRAKHQTGLPPTGLGSCRTPFPQTWIPNPISASLMTFVGRDPFSSPSSSFLKERIISHVSSSELVWSLYRCFCVARSSPVCEVCCSETSFSIIFKGSSNWCLVAFRIEAELMIVFSGLVAKAISNNKPLLVCIVPHGTFSPPASHVVKDRGLCDDFVCLRIGTVCLYLFIYCPYAFLLVSYIPRSANSVADGIAKYCLTMFSPD